MCCYWLWWWGQGPGHPQEWTGSHPGMGVASRSQVRSEDGTNIATLGSILDFQLDWKSFKFQLARWSLREAGLCREPQHPPTHQPPNLRHGNFILSMLCGVPTPISAPINKVCVVSPPSIDSFCAVSSPQNVVLCHSGSVLLSKAENVSSSSLRDEA